MIILLVSDGVAIPSFSRVGSAYELCPLAVVFAAECGVDVIVVVR